MRIFVGNLAWTTTEDELHHLFYSYGAVERVQIITDREMGRSRGFGFVEMPNAMEANAAIAGLDETVLGGRSLRGYPGTHQQRHAYITQHSCGNERQDDRMGQAY